MLNFRLFLYDKYVCVCAQMLSHVQLFVTPWTVTHQAPLSLELSRQEYLSGLPFPPPGDLPDPGIELMSPALARGFFTTEPPGKPSLMLETDLILTGSTQCIILNTLECLL